MTEKHLASPICILGAGAWGSALAILLARNGQNVRLWDIDTDNLTLMQKERMNPFRLPGVSFPEKLELVPNLEAALKGVQDVCLVVPSHTFRALLKKIKPLVHSNVRFVWGTKGLDPTTQSFLSEVVAEVYTEKTPAAALSGPSFAKEVASNLPTAVSLAGNNPAFLGSLVKRFQNDTFHVYKSDDFIGIQLYGAVKNVIAIATGISDGLECGTNARCALISRGLIEISTLCESLGGHADTALSLAGVGDLVLTCSDNQSRNRRFGLAIGGGRAASDALEDMTESVEGYYNAKQLYYLADKQGVNMPIAQQVYAILYESAPAKSILNEF